MSAFTSALRTTTRNVHAGRRLGSSSDILLVRATGLSQLRPSRAAAGSTRWLSSEARAVIDSAVKSKPLVLFMKGTPDAPQCGFSRTVIQLLDMQGVSRDNLTTYNVLADPDLRNDIKEYSEWPTVPQLYVNGEFVGGCDILLGMHQSGELEGVLVKGSILSPVEPAAPAP